MEVHTILETTDFSKGMIEQNQICMLERFHNDIIKSATKLENILVNQYGALTRRPGSIFINIDINAPSYTLRSKCNSYDIILYLEGKYLSYYCIDVNTNIVSSKIQYECGYINILNSYINEDMKSLYLYVDNGMDVLVISAVGQLIDISVISFNINYTNQNINEVSIIYNGPLLNYSLFPPANISSSYNIETSSIEMQVVSDDAKCIEEFSLHRRICIYNHNNELMDGYISSIIESTPYKVLFEVTSNKDMILSSSHIWMLGLPKATQDNPFVDCGCFYDHRYCVYKNIYNSAHDPQGFYIFLSKRYAINNFSPTMSVLNEESMQIEVDDINGAITIVKLYENDYIKEMFICNSKLFVYTNISLYILEVPYNTNVAKFYEVVRNIDIISYSENKCIIKTLDNKMFIYDAHGMQEVNILCKHDFLDHIVKISMVSSPYEMAIALLNNGQFLIGTIKTANNYSSIAWSVHSLQYKVLDIWTTMGRLYLYMHDNVIECIDLTKINKYDQNVVYLDRQILSHDFNITYSNGHASISLPQSFNNSSLLVVEGNHCIGKFIVNNGLITITYSNRLSRPQYKLGFNYISIFQLPNIYVLPIVGALNISTITLGYIYSKDIILSMPDSSINNSFGSTNLVNFDQAESSVEEMIINTQIAFNHKIILMQEGVSAMNINYLKITVNKM